MNAAGQAILEYLFLMAFFALFLGVVIRDIPKTFESASPFLAAKIEQRLETGAGFAGQNMWKAPAKPKGGVQD